MVKHTTETLGFNNFSGYYASVPEGYGGFDWFDVGYLNKTFWESDKTNWCDTGYQNVIHGAGEAFSFINTASYAEFGSSNLNEAFSLKSMVAASAWETSQPFDFVSFVYQDGALVAKASDKIHLSQTAQTIDFAKIGKPGDFRNIVAVDIVPGSGKYGNTCTYGAYGYTTGNVMAFDSLKVTWNGRIPRGTAKLFPPDPAMPAHGRQHHVVAARLALNDSHHGTGSSAHTGWTEHSGAQSGFHSELMSLGDSCPGGLTAQFHLPALEHFGT